MVLAMQEPAVSSQTEKIILIPLSLKAHWAELAEMEMEVSAVAPELVVRNGFMAVAVAGPAVQLLTVHITVQTFTTSLVAVHPLSQAD